MNRKAHLPWNMIVKFLIIGLDVVVFAVIGYLIGRHYGMEVYGTIFGAVLGIVCMHIHLFLALKRVEKRKSRPG